MSLDLMFVADNTGSMKYVANEVRTEIRKTTKYLFDKIPGIRIGMLFHGDYCDKDLCIQKIQPTTSLGNLERFLKNIKSAHGGDAPECYEYALKICNDDIQWQQNNKIIVMVGDESPHTPAYSYSLSSYFGKDFIVPNYKFELDRLFANNIKVYPVFCDTSGYRMFWDEIATKMGTPKLLLKNFADINGIITAASMSAIGKISEYKEDAIREGASDGIIGAIRMLEESDVLSVYNPKDDSVSSGIKVVDELKEKAKDSFEECNKASKIKITKKVNKHSKRGKDGKFIKA